jgi:hypothetical protein
MAILSFIQVAYSTKLDNKLFEAFANARKEHGEPSYEQIGSISPQQAEGLVRTAEVFVSRSAELLEPV